MRKTNNFFANIFSSIFGSKSINGKRAYFSKHQSFDFNARSLETSSAFSSTIEATFSKLENGVTTLQDEGFSLGLKSTNSNTTLPDEPLSVFYADCDKEQNAVLMIFDNQKNELQNNKEAVKKELATTIEERVKDNDELHRDTLNYAVIEFEGKKEDTTVMEERLISLNEEIENHELIIEQNKKVVGRNLFKKTILDTIFFLFASAGILAWIDMEIILPAFNSFKFPENLGRLLGVTLSIMTVVSSYLMAKFAEEDNSKNWWHSLFLGISVILFLASIRIVGSYQISIRNNVDVSFLTDFLFTGLSALFWFMTYLLEKHRLKRLPNFIAQKEIKRHKKARTNTIVKRAKLVEKYNRTLKLNDAKEKAFIQNYKGQVVERAKLVDRKLRMDLSNLSNQLASLQNLRMYFVSDIEAIKNYAKITFADNYRKGESKRRPPLNIYGKIGLFSLFLAFVLFSGCEAMEEHIDGKPDHHITRVVLDKTYAPKNQNQFDTMGMNVFLMELWGLNNNNAPRTQIDLYLSSIDDLFIQKDVHIPLEKGKPKSSRVKWDREDKIKLFREEVKQKSDKHFTYGEGKKQSKINLCLCRNLNALSEADSTAKKNLIVMSDFLEHTRNSFYHLKKEPYKLVGSDYKRLTKAFSEECSLEDLTGIKVIGVFKPMSLEQDEFIQYAVKFWEKYLTTHGAEFSFRANF